MKRILEPELMDDEAQSLAYANADFGESNQRFVDGLLERFDSSLRRVVDLGCGPGDVDIRLARAAPHAVVTAVDGSAAMIALARQSVKNAGLDARIALFAGRLPEGRLPAHSFDAVTSKDLLHHLPDPSVLWNEVIRLADRPAVVYIMDLIRPDTADAARRIVEAVAGAEAPILKHDFFNSLCAAFTIDEVREQLRSAALGHLDVTRSGDRHLLISGVLA